MRILIIWLVAVAGILAFVAFTSIGPIVVSFGFRHGVHATDLAVGVVVLAGAAWATVRTVRDGRHIEPTSPR